MSARVSLADAATIDKPRPLFEFDDNELGLTCHPVNCYSVAPDGRRFFALQPVNTDPPPPVTEIHLFQNWLAELEAKVPSGL